MCGRFAQIETISDLIKAYFVDDVLTEITPSYNIAPGSRILSIIRKDGKRLLVDFQWGLDTSLGKGGGNRPEDDKRAGGIRIREAEFQERLQDAALSYPGKRLL